METLQGPDPAKWSWGQMHACAFAIPWTTCRRRYSWISDPCHALAMNTLLTQLDSLTRRSIRIPEQVIAKSST